MSSAPLRSRRRAGLGVLVLLVLSGTAAAATSPTNDEWEPVRAALAADQADASARIQQLVQRFPQWPDGQRELAKRELHDGDLAGALASARTALKLDGDEVEAACVEVQVLTALKRYDEVWPAVDGFTGKDANGWLHFLGARAAWQAEDLPRAESLLDTAIARAPTSAPLDYFFLRSRLYLKKKDLEDARSELEQATQQYGDSPVAWYELGRVELELAAELQAQRDADKSREQVNHAVEHFEKAQQGLGEDPNLLYALGYARYEQAKRVLVEDEDRGKAELRDAVPVLTQAVEHQPDFALAHYVLGNVLVQLGEWKDAVTQLQRARELGTIDRPGLFNLALALERSGDRAGSAAILAHNQAQTPPEQIQVAMGAYHDHDFLLAASELQAVVPLLNDQPDTQAVVLRFLGHAHRQVAARLSGDDADAENEAAADAYARAAALHDHDAQEHYLALQTARGATTGFPAAWRYLRWRDFASLSGWSAWLGNYGSWLTGNRGFGGAWERHPLQTAAWCLLAGGPLVLFVLGALRRPRRGDEDQRDEVFEDDEVEAGSAEPRQAPRRSASRPPAPGSRRTPPAARQTPAPAVRPTPPGAVVRTPSAGVRQISARRTPSGNTPPPPASRDTTPAKGNARTPARGNAKQKAETEEMGTPPAGSQQLQPSPDPKSTGALERKPRR